jgi:tetratricopeptide (TPR) repeat protein
VEALARRVPREPLTGALLVLLIAAPAAAAGSGSILARYSFEDVVATGPDTFAIFQGARHVGTGQGRVSLSSAFHVSGYRSVEIKDVAGDGDFPELQGYFPVRTAGRLFFHFAFLTTDAKEELNVALAGPRFFQMEKDGIAFWLGTREGRLVHVSDSIPKKLFPVEAFVWYAVDVAYDLAAGTYTLTIHREGQETPLVALRDQPNSTRRAGSAVDKFSFVGSPYGDTSSVVYYVDDVVIGTDESVTQLPFVAPGRRKLFVDLFAEYQRQLRERPRCLPLTGPDDVGLSSADLADLGRAGLMDVVRRVFAGDPVEQADGAWPGPSRWRQVFGAVAQWNAGCQALDAGEARRALAHFEKASALVPDGKIFTLSSILALAGMKRFAEADERLLMLADGRDDPRYAVVSAYVGLARGDLDRAEAWLRDPASRVLDREANPLLAFFRKSVPADLLAALRAQLGDAFPGLLDETLVAEQYYYVQLWKGQYDAARDYALRMSERLRRGGLPASVWSARAGDAAFYRRDLGEARQLYEDAIRGEKDNGVLMALYLKLADIAHLSGDLETERALREHYYGALTE